MLKSDDDFLRLNLINLLRAFEMQDSEDLGEIIELILIKTGIEADLAG
jgi:hypothetical protein